MAIDQLSFNNRRRGRVNRAAWYLRLSRALRKKRVAIAHTGAVQAMQRAAREAGRLAHLAHVYGVPIDPMAKLPTVPALPDQAWIEHLRGMGPLKDPVRLEPVQADQVTA